MNYTVSTEDARRQMGPRAYGRVDELVRWLCPGTETDLEYRIAPSVITRCEAELFGVSTPRFALRARLPDGGLINARRLAEFARNVALVFANAPNDIELPATYSPQPLTLDTLNEWFVEPGQCVADSLLKVPSRLQENAGVAGGFHVLKVDLGIAYGEAEVLKGTPFIQHVPTAGGMCGHAATFMASVLLVPSIKFVCGLSEITAVAQGLAAQEGVVNLDLSDMKPQAIVDYFNNDIVGLQAYNQFWLSKHGDPKSFFASAIRGYLMSDMPLILPVDLGRMWGDCIEPARRSVIARNSIPIERMDPETIRKEPHAVVLVGCHPSDDRYLLNDPATYPFLEATIDDLLAIRRYTEDDDGAPRRDYPLEPPTFISATPREVRMPLLDSYIDHIYRFGLLRCAQSLQISWAPIPGIPLWYDRKNFHPGEWRIVDFGKEEGDVRKSLRFLPPNAIDAIFQAIAGQQLAKNWYWVQHLSLSDMAGLATESVWIWDAESEPPSGMARSQDLLVSLLYPAPGGAWHAAFLQSPPASRRAETSETPASGIGRDYNGLIKASLMSSFCPLGASQEDRVALQPYDPAHPTYRPAGDWLRSVAIESVPAEVYLMMQNEVEYWIRKWGDSGGSRTAYWGTQDEKMTAVEFLSLLNGQEISQIAEQLHQDFTARNSKIVAVASFVPEIGCRHVGERGIKAIRNLIGFARHLQSLEHPTHTLELVAGSRHQGIRAGMSNDRRALMFRFRVASQTRALEQLVNNLTRLRDDLADEDKYVNLALEPEPGVHFNLSNWSTIVEFSNALQQMPADDPIRRRVGINLDIGHWRLSDIKPQDVRRNLAVCRRIAHAHIAGHHCCTHFGDSRLFDLVAPEKYREWLDLLRDITQKKQKAKTENRHFFPEYSGYVSVEMEMARDDDLAASSFVQARWLGL